MNYYTFKQKLAESYLGTKEIRRFYKKKGIILYSVENIPEFNNPDIDLVRKLANEKWEKIEVKVCIIGHSSGNFFLETVSNEDKDTEGCLLTTKSDKLYYYLYKSKKLYIFDTKLLKEWILENKVKYEEKEVRTPVGDEFYTTLGITPRIYKVVKDLKPEIVNVK